MEDGILEGLENFETEDDQLIDVTISNEEHNIYPEANIKVERSQYSVYELNRKYLREQLILDPDFQREVVWIKDQQSELIESVLMGIPLPIFYLNETKDGELVVIDGRQRLTTFFSFLNNEFKLKNLKVLNSLNGLHFKELEEKMKANLEDFQIIAQVIKPPTPDRIKFDIFDRVNRGGTPLNNQEMRNALYQGKSTTLLRNLVQLDIFKFVTSNSINSTRMKDRYLVLRFISFYLWRKGLLLDPNGSPIEYKNDIDEFLGKSMEYLNKCNDNKIEYLTDLFMNTMQNNFIVFGKDSSFRRLSNSDKKNPINMILFEAFGYLFAHFDQNYCIENKECLKDMCNQLLSTKELNKLLTDDRGRGVVIPDVFSMFDDLKERLLHDNKFND
ncbi:DUF262 domain-containing protein [Jeotgalibacillus salarius]|uniref:DUF262 domain-containing protein n=1 Tax=Jeotgalibacillus salarius TaxID=546023 RepID=A0A4Y8LPC7_9BACL|nr:DUF262 domain-containing protein [Jeotgalibacillus salarius]TFE03851.1 DUF262 domain-containing protein [Jeotgalibacillus salarius]